MVSGNSKYDINVFSSSGPGIIRRTVLYFGRDNGCFNVYVC